MDVSVSLLEREGGEKDEKKTRNLILPKQLSFKFSFVLHDLHI